MAKRINTPGKPKEILELEEVLGIPFLRHRILTAQFFREGEVLDNEKKAYYQYNARTRSIKEIILINIEISNSDFFVPFNNINQLVLIQNAILCSELIIPKGLEKLVLFKSTVLPFHYMPIDLLRLSIEQCQISSIKGLERLKKLRILYLKKNEISDLSNLLDMSELKVVDARHNLISTVPKELAERFGWLHNSLLKGDSLFSMSEFYLEGNPLEYPPPSVIQFGPNTVKNYYEMAEEYGDEPLSEGRIIVVGDGSSGKSSLIERLLYGQFEEGKTQTNGINIENWELGYKDRELTFHFWDFGGQEIQHAVHKFFFTEGCLYVLVLDNRKEEEPEYWLQQIESLGGKAPVLVVFNKSDENATEIADRKFLKEKYPNIVGFYQTSCKTGFGIDDFKKKLEEEAVKLRTVHERLPNNWLNIKKELEQLTSGERHYLTYEVYQEICKANNTPQEEAQKLLLRYFTTIGAITWFGDTYLNFLHVLSPAWITQGVYKIITAKKTARLFGQISVSDFKELLYPEGENDFTYDEGHYGYLLSMMKKFELCHTTDDEHILIPSAFGKEPKVEYSEFRGEDVRTYILQFRDYMPLAIIHRYIAKNLPDAYENNYWYSGIVIRDSKSSALAMVHADKEAKRIYIRIKGESPLGQWEHIRRELDAIISSYAAINYSELVSLDERSTATVDYEDLLSYLRAGKKVYFHPKLQRDYNVGYLMGLFESKESTIEKVEKGVIAFDALAHRQDKVQIPQFVVQILNNNSPQVIAQASNQVQIDIDIDVQVINNISSEIQGDARYLLDELKESNDELKETLQKVIEFTNDTKSAKNSGEVIEKGWGRRLKNVVKALKSAKEQVKQIEDGKEAIDSILQGLKNLAGQFDFQSVAELIA